MKMWPSVALTVPDYTHHSTALCIRFEAAIPPPEALVPRVGAVTKLTLGDPFA